MYVTAGELSADVPPSGFCHHDWDQTRTSCPLEINHHHSSLQCGTDDGDTRLRYRKIQYLKIVARMTGNVAMNNMMKFSWAGNPR